MKSTFPLAFIVLATFLAGNTVADDDPRPVATHQTGWFHEDLIRSRALHRQPVHELDGRFILIAREANLSRFGQERTAHNLRMLKHMGVTDIIQLNIRGNSVYHQTEAPGARLKFGPQSDPLLDFVRAAAREEIGVWIKLQMHQVEGDEQLLARDAQGHPYRYGAATLADTVGRAYREMLYALIEEYATKYIRYGSLKGFYIDMPYIAYADYHGDDVALFDSFCREHFGEPLPDDIGEKLALGGGWRDPDDRFWRRFVLFKQWVSEEFIKDIAAHSRSQGLGFGLHLCPPVIAGSGWAWGHHPARLARHADWIFNYPGAVSHEPIYAYPHSWPGFFPRKTWGELHTYSFRGRASGIGFPFNRLRTPVLLGDTRRAMAEMIRHIRNTREWSGAETLERVAVLHNQNNLLLRLGDARVEFNRELEIVRQLSGALGVGMLFVEHTEAFAGFRVLIAPSYSLGGLSEENLESLRAFVEAGGILLNLNARITTARPDLTGEKDVSGDWVGSGPETTTPDGWLTYREQDLGAGRVITLLAPTLPLGAEAEDRADIEAAVTAWVLDFARPEITVAQSPESPTSVRVISSLRKNNWVAAALLGDAPGPAQCVLRFDVERLGLAAAQYRVLLLGREMELLPPGDYHGRRYWTAEQISQGFTVTILSDNEVDFKPLPETLDLSEYQERDREHIARWLPVNWNERARQQRHYEHEIVVIAPYDELTIAGERCCEDTPE